MIASLEGIIAEASPTNIVLEVGGVGYEVHVRSLQQNASWTQSKD